MISIDGHNYYTALEACEVLGIKLPTLYSYVNRGLIRSYRQSIRRERLYRKSEIDALLDIVPESPAAQIPPAESWASEI